MKNLYIKTSNKEYEVIIDNGIIKNFNKYFENDNRKKFVIYDSNIPEFFMKRIAELDNSYFYAYEASEKNKNFKEVSLIVNKMVEDNISRNDIIVAIGGGITIDVASFVASIYKRGIEYVSMPTTLLAMVDVCIGGKTGINNDDYKNMIGTFYQPSKVLIDHTFLGTIDEENFMCGLIESFKMALVSDPSIIQLINDFFDESKSDNIDEIIYNSLMVKKYYVENDEFDKGIRNILNFGHTFGHALEKASNFKIKHGFAVGIGMAYESNEEIRKIIVDVLNKFGVDMDIKKYMPKVLDYIISDKKVDNSYINQIFVDSIGHAYIKNVSIEDYLKWISR